LFWRRWLIVAQAERIEAGRPELEPAARNDVAGKVN